MDSISSIIWAVSFVLVTVTVTGLSQRIGWSSPIVLVVIGGLCSFLPALPVIHIDSDAILFGVLPPLLFASAIRTPLTDIRARGDSILLLSVGLVALTVVVVGLVTWWIIPALSLAAALAFGAIVAPTDAVAVSAIARRVGLPRRVLAILETESLLNDATALVALNASIAAILSFVSPWRVAGDFVIAVTVGVTFGLIVGFVMGFIRERTVSPVLDTSISLVVPYIAFIPTQLLGGSGILAVVVAGLYLGHRAPLIRSTESRIATSINWRTIRFLLENAVFLFIGLSLSQIVGQMQQSGHTLWKVVGLSALVLAVLVLVRFANVMSTLALYRIGTPRMRRTAWSWRTGVAVSSAGIRGVVTLAAAFLLPAATPERELLQFLAFVVVIGSLLEGLALPAILRVLRLPPPSADQERVEREQLLTEAQLAGLAQLDAEPIAPGQEHLVEELRRRGSSSIAVLGAAAPNGEPFVVTFERLRQRMLQAERTAVLTARSEGRFQDPAVRAVLGRIDAEEEALRQGVVAAR